MKSNRWMRKQGIIAAATALLCTTPAMAVHYACSGPVNGVTVNPSGVVSAAAAGGQSWGFFCQLGSSVNNVSSEACKGILAVLMTAQTSGKTVTLWYDDNLTCGTHPSWAWLDTVYWGPSMSD